MDTPILPYHPTGKSSAEHRIPCFECGEPSDYNHHVIPRSIGGKNTVPLCAGCHGKIHGITFTMNHGMLIKRGMAKARSRGGRPLVISPEQAAMIWALLGEGKSKNHICKVVGCRRTTLYDFLARHRAHGFVQG